MKTITWHCETGKQDGDFGDEFEVDDTATDEEIDAMVREEVFNIVSWGWSVKDV